MSFAMNRHIKAGKKVEIDPEAADKLQVCRADFMHAFENDIKPAFGVSKEEFDSYISNGIILWGQPVTDVLEEGQLRIRQTIKSEMTPLVSILIEGPPNSGKTALAAHIALLSKFPYLKFCTAQTMLGFSEIAKCQQLKKIFEDAHKSSLSCVVVDELETLLEYAPVGPRYSNNVLQTLKLLFKRPPPKGRKLLIIATTSYRDILDQLGLSASFSKIIHIANMTSGQHILHVLSELEHCFNDDEMKYLEKKLHNKKVWIGIKALLDLIEVARQADDGSRVVRFLAQLEEVAGMV
jgi:vesicle-fusing ATPase